MIYCQCISCSIKGSNNFGGIDPVETDVIITVFKGRKFIYQNYRFYRFKYLKNTFSLAFFSDVIGENLKVNKSKGICKLLILDLK